MIFANQFASKVIVSRKHNCEMIYSDIRTPIQSP